MEEVTKTEKGKKPVLTIALGILTIVALGVAGFYFNKYQKTNKILTNPEGVNAEEAKKLTSKISKFYNLPAGETPNVATVLDIEKLKDQPFFKDAKNGDKVLIYQKAGLAILYRTSTNKIVNVSPVSGSPAPSAAPNAAETQVPVLPKQSAKPAEIVVEPSTTPTQ